MNTKEKFRLIKRAIKKAERGFTPMIGKTPDKYLRSDIWTLEQNFCIYASALGAIENILNGKKEVWVKCPYCNLKFTKYIKANDKRKVVWCETCDKNTGKLR